MSTNQQGHLEFIAEILDDSGNATSADFGSYVSETTVHRFGPTALLQTHMHSHFPRFVFHDGVFESLDDRKKDNLLGVIRSNANLGIQHIITLIDSDLPKLHRKTRGRYLMSRKSSYDFMTKMTVVASSR